MGAAPLGPSEYQAAPEYDPDDSPLETEQDQRLGRLQVQQPQRWQERSNRRGFDRRRTNRSQAAPPTIMTVANAISRLTQSKRREGTRFLYRRGAQLASMFTNPR